MCRAPAFVQMRQQNPRRLSLNPLSCRICCSRHRWHRKAHHRCRPCPCRCGSLQTASLLLLSCQDDMLHLPQAEWPLRSFYPAQNNTVLPFPSASIIPPSSLRKIKFSLFFSKFFSKCHLFFIICPFLTESKNFSPAKSGCFGAEKKDIPFGISLQIC